PPATTFRSTGAWQWTERNERERAVRDWEKGYAADAHNRPDLRRAWYPRRTDRVCGRSGGILRGRRCPGRRPRRNQVGERAPARWRDHRFGPGLVDTADRGHPMECAGCQHPPSAVLVPRAWRGEIHE